MTAAYFNLRGRYRSLGRSFRIRHITHRSAAYFRRIHSANYFPHSANYQHPRSVAIGQTNNQPGKLQSPLTLNATCRAISSFYFWSYRLNRQSSSSGRHIAGRHDYGDIDGKTANRHPVRRYRAQVAPTWPLCVAPAPRHRRHSPSGNDISTDRPQ